MSQPMQILIFQERYHQKQSNNLQTLLINSRRK